MIILVTTFITYLVMKDIDSVYYIYIPMILNLWWVFFLFTRLTILQDSGPLISVKYWIWYFFWPFLLVYQKLIKREEENNENNENNV